jgi:hypothetical protein
LAASYQSVRRFVSRLHPNQSPEACEVIETALGEESQADYGAGPMVRDTHSGKYRCTRLFVLTLGYSRKSVRLIALRSSPQTWAELHENAFRRLTGLTHVVVLDNLREGVLVHPAPLARTCRQPRREAVFGTRARPGHDVGGSWRYSGHSRNQVGPKRKELARLRPGKASRKRVRFPLALAERTRTVRLSGYRCRIAITIPSAHLRHGLPHK